MDGLLNVRAEDYPGYLAQLGITVGISFSNTFNIALNAQATQEQFYYAQLPQQLLLIRKGLPDIGCLRKVIMYNIINKLRQQTNVR